MEGKAPAAALPTGASAPPPRVGTSPAVQPPGESAAAKDDTPAEPSREDDWGIAPARSGMGRETKLGFAFVLVLLVVFGFVVYKKVEQRKIQRGDLLAGMAPSTTEKEPLPGTSPTENSAAGFGSSVQNNDPFAESLPPAQREPATSPADWQREPSNAPPPQTEVSVPPMAQTQVVSSQSINQYPPGSSAQWPEPAGQFEPPIEATAPPAVNGNVPYQSTSATVRTVTEPSEFNSATTQEVELAQAPVPSGFEPPVDFSGQNSIPTEPPAAMPMEPGEAEAVPFPAEPGATSATPAPPIGNDFFSEAQTTQTQPMSEGAASDPFGALPASPIAEQPPISQAPVVPGDPFAMPATVTIPETPVATTPPLQEQENPMAAFGSGDSLMPNATAPVPVPRQNDPRFGDFQPATTANNYEPEPSGGTATTGQQPINPFPQANSAETPPQPFEPATEPAEVETPIVLTGTPTLVQPSDHPEVYEVRPGDNYWNVSKKHYGTIRYFHALARYNQHRIADPRKMRPGMKVLLPPREVLESRNPDLFPKFTARSGDVSNVAHRAGGDGQTSGFFLDGNGTPMYQVGPDDTLGGIAQRHLGRFSRWVEIYQLNRHRLKNPNALTLGEVLHLPPDASQVRMVRQAAGIR